MYTVPPKRLRICHRRCFAWRVFRNCVSFSSYENVKVEISKSASNYLIFSASRSDARYNYDAVTIACEIWNVRSIFAVVVIKLQKHKSLRFYIIFWSSSSVIQTHLFRYRFDSYNSFCNHRTNSYRTNIVI